MRRAGLLLALLAVLAACAGTAAFLHWRAGKVALLTPAAAPIPPRPAPPDVQGGVLLFGDSRIAYWRPLPKRPFPVIRHGRAGESAIRLAPGFAAALDRHRPEMAIVQLGLNDAIAASLVGEARREQALADTTAALARIAAEAQARGVRLVFLRIIPWSRPDPVRRVIGRGEVDRYVERLNAALPEIAAAHGATVADPLPLLATTADAIPAAYRADPGHFTPEGYARLNALIPESLK